VALLIAPGALAKTVLVGTCLPNLQTYPTISQAVSAVAPGSTVLVCPGTYPEQVTITQPITLRGVRNGNAANPLITVPPGGLTKNVDSPINGIPIFYQILVQGTESEPVNISNIAVDGSNSQVPGGNGLAGIYYENASGVVDKVAVYNELAARAGYGILLDNTTSSVKTITVANSSIHDFDAEGIRSNVRPTPSTLAVRISSNSVVTTNTLGGNPVDAGGIDIDAVGTISRNRVLTHPQQQGISSGVGISTLSSSIITNNTVDGFTIGIWEIGDSNTIKLNRVSLAEGGILVSGRNNVVKGNSIMDIIHGGAAIGFNCTGTSNIVTHNIINDSYYGIIDHAGNIISPNSFSNVTQLVSPPC